ncbi:mannitol dehydrogenase family protein [Mesorhizobium sp. M7A.F.Ca.CA.001.09.2.1]|uniref:mannitol dehydrogenase family protein n=1 Tax=unclassified Mesorhizobium TaxID=325217 RepID=UPI000FCA3AFA|nr:MULTISPECIES: mannitol dehydrogenase family protein [unclassified Mesorhizobium]RUY38565.1 mannitol dehydrogenase family protein [Mesorhizobium sp. M7A.F.Ca.CA.001.13.2.1]RUY71184.1 mannitol dehydrogenase family protein [Mesorhizobium sp. M7A.F.Ca.CA.001.13.1.1]RUY73899.1 mannitol dehydrogenase family protein [Mesorhizobium sp. M7A.F.Ca.CA.001.05.1.1]RUY81682.1 mannitol dehydrogenase family protein [Mesorhizobium sp. M7A.F.Ca.CA.001.09.2.1]RUY98856.1 mannitol dehydrogenase family protein [M
MTVKLSSSNLSKLPANVAGPKYDRATLKAGIVHFGVGNFHRSHQAVYLDDLFNAGIGHDWALIGAGVFDGEKIGRAKLEEQDWLTTVVEQDSGHMNTRVTGAMIDFLMPGDAAGVIERLTDPAIKIVSLTITEGGYFIDPASGVFNPTHPDIVADAQPGATPKTVFGIILAGLVRRRDEGTVPFTVMSCDNIPHNGHVTSDGVIGLARLIDQDLANWLSEHVAFPNGMVDRITPATTDRERGILAKDFGLEDNWPVFCEPFRQWVLEDHFTDGRPPLEKVGVQFVKDVAPYELMKIRILNGGHAAIAYPAGLMDIHFVHEAMQEPLVSGFLAKLERDEIIPTVPPVPDTVLEDYYQLIESRFSNPKIGDTVRRLCLDGSNRQPKFIIPTIADRLKAGKSVAGLALESALWCRYCFGTTDSGAVIEPNDPSWDRLQATAKAAKDAPAAWLAMEDIYGDVGRATAFVEAFAHALNVLWANGARATLTRYLAGKL